MSPKARYYGKSQTEKYGKRSMTATSWNGKMECWKYRSYGDQPRLARLNDGKGLEDGFVGWTSLV